MLHDPRTHKTAYSHFDGNDPLPLLQLDVIAEWTDGLSSSPFGSFNLLDDLADATSVNVPLVGKTLLQLLFLLLEMPARVIFHIKLRLFGDQILLLGLRIPFRLDNASTQIFHLLLNHFALLSALHDIGLKGGTRPISALLNLLFLDTNPRPEGFNFAARLSESLFLPMLVPLYNDDVSK